MQASFSIELILQSSSDPSLDSCSSAIDGDISLHEIDSSSSLDPDDAVPKTPSKGIFKSDSGPSEQFIYVRASLPSRRYL